MNWKNAIKGVLGFAAMLGTGYMLIGAAPATTSTPPPGPGLDLINQRCGFCHTTASIFTRHKSRDDWAATVQQMADRGAAVSPAEMKTIVDYLAANYPAANGAGDKPSPTPGS
jgi:hypothetical protein